ncbi:biogenesis of lysosome-related organelles complex 1 subunit 4 isoform X2 [Callorhinchus milii]|uniref:biogenesis of lysosome-related organelles complex 1 subunit 4 isoform X2 n=1 Tax=Callorhinchus milii TaxID=7868 RepID=UPI0004573409|nr:biogenesis of lysosome-related organelles complex 1 subunit 4 isoform X2 [Callorhinchus milii]|eukprot:gi/632939446/ref/XP_007910093.1/ PREDICTED: breast carcinoma-amplified sequence 4 [Callorhinchus milii]
MSGETERVAARVPGESGSEPGSAAATPGTGPGAGTGPRSQVLAREVAACLLAEPRSEAQELDESVEEMLIRLDEFCGMLDMIRNDTSQILSEDIPNTKVKAFVKMVGQNAAMLEEQVVRAEKDYGNFPCGVCKLLHSISTPAFLHKKRTFLNQQSSTYELPNLYRSEDYFPGSSNPGYLKKPNT